MSELSSQGPLLMDYNLKVYQQRKSTSCSKLVLNSNACNIYLSPVPCFRRWVPNWHRRAPGLGHVSVNEVELHLLLQNLPVVFIITSLSHYIPLLPLLPIITYYWPTNLEMSSTWSSSDLNWALQRQARVPVPFTLKFSTCIQLEVQLEVPSNLNSWPWLQ